VDGINWNLDLLKGENSQIKEQTQKIKEKSAKAVDEALQWAAAAEARAAEMEAVIAKIKDKVTQTESDLVIEREASDKLRAQLSEASSSSIKKFLGSNSFKYSSLSVNSTNWRSSIHSLPNRWVSLQ
jgi:metal-dependent amidase/aminoacylase/carboxypeptidase family protein